MKFIDMISFMAISSVLGVVLAVLVVVILKNIFGG